MKQFCAVPPFDGWLRKWVYLHVGDHPAEPWLRLVRGVEIRIAVPDEVGGVGALVESDITPGKTCALGFKEV